MEQYTVRGPAALAYTCSCLYVFGIISHFGKVVDYVEFPYSLRNVAYGVQT